MHHTWKRIYLNWPIRFKLFLWIVPIITVAIGLTGYFSYSVASQQVLSKTSRNQSGLARQNLDHIDYVAQDAIDFSNSLLLFGPAQELLSTPDDADVRRQAFTSLSTLMVTRNSIQSLIIYPIREDGEARAEPFAIDQTGLTSAMPFTPFIATSLAQKALRLNGKEAWALVRPADKLFIGDRENKIVIAKLIKDASSLRNRAIIVVGMQESRLLAHLLSNQDPNTETFILDENGTILTGTDGRWTGSHYSTLPYKELRMLEVSSLPEHAESGQWLISSASSALTGWHAVVIQPKEVLLKELGRIGFITATFMGLCLLAALLLAWFAATFITDPLRKLLESMRLLQTGDFTQRVQFTGADEIGQLGRGYDLMVERIKGLIDDVYSTRLKQREAELKTLQEQINPHFLYNTLDTIYWSANRKNDHEIAEMVYALSRMFRIRLSGGNSVITLGQELELARHYLHLQQLRFKNRLHYELMAEAAAEAALVPKLLIQPLIENAVIHGIEPMGGDGLIQIGCRIAEGALQISVTDNGVGIPGDELAGLSAAGDGSPSAGAAPSPMRGFAIRNIKERLALAYGPEAGLHIRSQPGKGTTVSIRIPWKGD